MGEVDGVEVFYRDHESGHKGVGEWEAPYGDTTIIYVYMVSQRYYIASIPRRKAGIHLGDCCEE